MDKYINQLFMQLSQKYKVTIVTIMSYNTKYRRSNKTYKLIIDKKTKKSKYPEEKISLDFSSKQSLIQELLNWQ